jgi:5-methylcytosine-specific restriction endonuclease McrA
MRNRGFVIRRKSDARKGDSGRSVDDIVRELKRATSPPLDYRERSLRIHGLICAKCAREFGEKDRHLLTVHHKDGNHRNNPPDGSNWENLCVYCHEDEHSRERLGDYLSGKRKR